MRKAVDIDYIRSLALELERARQNAPEREPVFPPDSYFERDEFCYNQFGMSEREYRQEMAIWNKER